MKVKVRRMKNRDIPQVQKVANISWRSTYDGIIPEHIQENFLLNAYHESVLKKRRRKTHFYIAESEGEIVGFATYSKVDMNKRSHLHALYLLPEFQRKGIGSKLLEYAINQLGLEAITLDVEHQNFPAIQFYKKKGFVKVSEFEETVDGHTIHTIRMKWEKDEGN